MTRTIRAASMPIWIVLLAAVLSVAVISDQRHVAHRAQWLPSIAVAAPAVQSQAAPVPAATVTAPESEPGSTSTGTPSVVASQAPDVPQQAPVTNGCSTNRLGSTMHPACVTGAQVPTGG